MTSTRTLRLATRTSRLALWQANHVADLIRARDPEIQVEIVELSTEGDRDRITRLASLGGQGVFTREIQAAVLEGRADVAVHSLKDLPTDPMEGLLLSGIPRRGPRFDVLVLPLGRKIASCDELPAGARIGSGSLRRQAQLLHARSDFKLLEIRGNVETRLGKLDAGEYEAVLLAEAGLMRLGLEERVSLRLTPPLMFPAVGQAALGLECRADDEETQAILKSISDDETSREVRAERACLKALRAGCHAPVGVLCQLDKTRGQLALDAVVLSPDGQQRLSEQATAASDQPEQLGQKLAEKLLAAGADALIRGQSG